MTSKELDEIQLLICMAQWSQVIKLGRAIFTVHLYRLNSQLTFLRLKNQEIVLQDMLRGRGGLS